MSAVRRATSPALATRSRGLTSMPTDTKKRTANASRKGSTSAPTWWLSGDSATTTPARNAPSAIDTPNSVAAVRAMPSDMVRATSRNSSRDCMRAMRRRIHGHDARAQQQHERDEGGRLEQGEPEGRRLDARSVPRPARAGSGGAAPWPGPRAPASPRRCARGGCRGGPRPSGCAGGRPCWRWRWPARARCWPRPTSPTSGPGRSRGRW